MPSFIWLQLVIKIMEKIKEKQLSILNDTISHYNSNNRSYINGSCVYYPTENSEGCAVGRLVKDKELCKALGTSSVNNIFSSLPDDIKELGHDFLNDLQQLHDNKDNWDGHGLSEKGKNAVERLIHDNALF